MSLVYFKYDVVLIYEATYARKRYSTKITHNGTHNSTLINSGLILGLTECYSHNRIYVSSSSWYLTAFTNYFFK